MRPLPRNRYSRLALKLRGTAGIVAAFAAAGMLLAATATASAPIAGISSAGKAPVAGKSAEDLVSYRTKGKLKIAKTVRYKFVCSVDCQVTVTSDLAVKGVSIAPLTITGAFAPGQLVEATVTMSKGLRAAIAANIGTAKMHTKIAATALATGESDTDTRTFKFKRSGKKK
jgi:hypothetical protein